MSNIKNKTYKEQYFALNKQVTDEINKIAKPYYTFENSKKINIEITDIGIRVTGAFEDYHLLWMWYDNGLTYFYTEDDYIITLDDYFDLFDKIDILEQLKS